MSPIDPSVFDDVQERLKETSGRARGQFKSGAGTSPLAGKLFDETGDRLTPSHANKKGRRYRYYVSRRMIVGDDGNSDRSNAECGWRLPAASLEEQLASAVLSHLRSRLPVDLLINPAADVIRRLRNLLNEATILDATQRLTVVLPCINRATIKPGKIELSLDRDSIAGWLAITSQAINPDRMILAIPFQFRKRGVETKLIIGTDSPRIVDETLIRNIAKAHQYFDGIKQGQTFEQIAAEENLSKKRIHQLIDLAFLAPDIVRSILQGDQPVGLTAQWLVQNPMPADWNVQRRIVATL